MLWVDWPPVGSESALPDEVLLGLTCEDPTFMQGTAFSATLPTQPLAPLPIAMLPKLAALSGSAPCIRDGSTLQQVEWPRVGSESALPDEVLLGLCYEDPAFMEGTAVSAPLPTQPLAPLPTAMLPKLAALSGSAPCIGDGSTLQQVEWPRVWSESALPDEVLLGLCCEDPAFMQGTAFSAPLATQPLARLPTAMLPKLAARSGSAPCIGDGSTLQQVEWPRVGSESALPDEVLLGLCCEDPAFMQGTAFSAPLPTQPLAPLPTAMLPKLAALSGSAPCIGDGSTLQQVEWPRVGSESALPDEVLLGLCCEDPAFMQVTAFSAPLPTQPLAPLPTAMLPKLAALSGSATCIGDGSTLQQVEWPRVGSESTLLDDVLLGLCCEGPASAQRAALSAPPPTQPRAPAALCAFAPGSTSSCISAVLAGSTCGTEEQEYVDACIDALWNGSNTDNNSNGADNNSNGADNGGIDNHSDRDMGALFLNTHVVHVLLSGSALTMPLPSGPQSQGPAPPCAAGTAVLEWAVEQGVTVEEGRQLHRQQQFLTNPRPVVLQQPFSSGALPALCHPPVASLARHGLYSGS
ncbi:unnamed protein product [Closterium sp. NIES-65]|nr:unnamed protein product [Closterium sp. NIES-65]